MCVPQLSVVLHCMLQRVHARHAIITTDVPCTQQVARVAVERAVRRTVAHQRQDGLAHRVQRPRWCPAVFEDIQAYFSSLWRWLLHATCVSVQMVITLKWTFGWKILVAKCTKGGAKG